MKIVFFGTPDYVIPVVEKLHKEFTSHSGESSIAAVVTQTPKPSGRKQELLFSAVDSWAHKKKIPIYFDPNNIVSDNIGADLGVVASYGKIIPKSVIDYFPKGILNIHPSLLPEFRGSSPVQATILTGAQAGSTIIKIDGQMDHGPILTQFNDVTLPADTTEALRKRLFERSAEVLTTLIPAYLAGKVKPRDQNHASATFTRQITKEDAFIDPEQLGVALKGKISKKEWEISFIKDFTNHYSPTTVHQFIRAMFPWPGAWTEIHVTSDKQQVTRRLKILKAHLEPSTDHQPLVIDTVQLEGRGVVSWKQFKEGYPEAKFEK